MAANRTMIMERDGLEWRYSSNGWNSVFLPITNCSVDNAFEVRILYKKFINFQFINRYFNIGK